MIGLRKIWDPVNLRADIALYHGALDTRALLETMIIDSLFSDRRADPSDRLPPGETSRRGWWGDSYAEKRGWQFGSRLWLLENATTYPGLPLAAKGYMTEALAWMIEDGIARTVEAEAWFAPQNKRQLDGIVRVYRPNVPDSLDFAFAGIWREAQRLG